MYVALANTGESVVKITGKRTMKMTAPVTIKIIDIIILSISIFNLSPLSLQIQ